MRAPSFARGYARAVNPAAAPEQWAGLVAAWNPALGVQGTQLYDLSGYGAHGTLVGPVTAVITERGHALHFAGGTSVVDCGNPLRLQLTGSMTVMCWVYKSNNVAAHVYVSKQGGSSTRGWNLYSFDGGSGYHAVFDVAITNSTTSQREGTIILPVTTWVHLAGVYTAGATPSLDVYVNGVLNNGTLTGAVPTSQANSIEPVYLGAKPVSGGQQLMVGDLQDARVYNRALAPSEIFTIYLDSLGMYRLKPSVALHRKGVPPPATTLASLPPDAILASTNLTGAVGDIDESPSSPDASWLTATSTPAATDLRVSFGTPPGNPYGAQNFRVYVRQKTSGSGTPPTLTAELRQNNVLRRTCFTGQAITSTSGQVLQADWAAGDLVGAPSDPGSDVELRLVSVPGNALDTGALPAWNSQGTLLNNITLGGTNNVGVPAHTAGDLLLLIVLMRNTNTPNDQNLTSINTAGWTQLGGAGNAYGPPTTHNARLGVGWKIGDGSEINVSITTVGGTTQDLLLARVQRFTATNGFAPTAVAHVSTETSGTGTTVSMPTVNPGGATNRVAVAAIANSVNTAFPASTGESGGIWTEPVAENAVTNGTVGFMISNQSGGASISGGTFAITSGDWVTVGFTLEPALLVGAAESTVEVGAVEWNVRYLTPTGTPVERSALTPLDALAGLTAARPTRWDASAGLTDTALTPVESLTSSIQTRLSPWVSLIGALQARLSPLDQLAGLSPTRVTLWESGGLLAIVQTKVTPYEAIMSLVQTRLSPWASTLGLTDTALTPLEALIGLVQARASRWETLVSLLQARLSPWSAAAAIQSARLSPWDTQGIVNQVAQTRLTPFEALTAVSSTDLVPSWIPEGWAPDGWIVQAEAIAHATPWEASIIAVLAQSRVTPWEGVFSLLTTRVSPYEATGVGLSQVRVSPYEAQQALTVPRLSPWETLVSRLQTKLSPVESLVSLVQSRLAPWAATQGLVTARLSIWEQTLSLLTTRLSPYEATGTGLSISRVSPYEAVGLLQRVALAPWHSGISLTMSKTTPSESLMAVLQSKLTRVENLAGLSTTRLPLWEARGLTSSTRAGLWEALTGPILRTRLSPLESLLGMSDLAIVLYEGRGIAVALRLAPWESISFIPILPLFTIEVPEEDLSHTPLVGLQLVSVEAEDLAHLAPVRPSEVEVDEENLFHTPVVSLVGVTVDEEDFAHTAETRVVLT